MFHQAARVRPTLADEVAIVTGASSRIGAATARELGRRGATVVLAARHMGDVEAHLHAIRTAGGEAMAIPTDAADSDELALLVERTMAAFGRVDVLVNNSGRAGWLRWRRAPPTRSSGWCRSICFARCCLRAPCCRACWSGATGRSSQWYRSRGGQRRSRSTRPPSLACGASRSPFAGKSSEAACRSHSSTREGRQHDEARQDSPPRPGARGHDDRRSRQRAAPRGGAPA